MKQYSFTQDENLALYIQVVWQFKFQKRLYFSDRLSGLCLFFIVCTLGSRPKKHLHMEIIVLVIVASTNNLMSIDLLASAILLTWVNVSRVRVLAGIVSQAL